MAAVKILARVAKKYPQAAYAGFCFSLQCEWDYISRIVPGVAPYLAPLKDAIRQHFLPALFDVPPDAMTAEWRAHLAKSVKGAGIGVRNPVDAAPHSFETSKLATSYLVSHLIEGGRFSTNHHSAVVSGAVRSTSSGGRLGSLNCSWSVKEETWR